MTIPSSAYQITVDSSGNLGTYNIASGAEISYFTSVGNLVISGNYLGDNYEINGGYRFWGNDSNGVVMFLGADAYSGYGDQILDFGVNTNQQTNSGGLPSPTASYGGGLFRFDLRSNPNICNSQSAYTYASPSYKRNRPS